MIWQESRHRLVALLRYVLAAILTCSTLCDARGPVGVRGYFRSNGTYVAPHYRSAPDGNFSNNWSTAGNVNPYTGREGTRISPPSPRYANPTPVGAPPVASVNRMPSGIPSVGTTPHRTGSYVEGVASGRFESQTPLLSVISAVQLALIERGLRTSPPNDELDLETRRALEQFQRTRGLPAHGRMDRLTLATLGVSIP